MYSLITMKLGNTENPWRRCLNISDSSKTLGCPFYFHFMNFLSPWEPPWAVAGVMDPWGMQTWPTEDSFKLRSFESEQVWLCPRGDSHTNRPLWLQTLPPACQHPLHRANVPSSTATVTHLFLLVPAGHALQRASRAFHTFSSKLKISGKLSEHPILFTRPEF